MSIPFLLNMKRKCKQWCSTTSPIYSCWIIFTVRPHVNHVVSKVMYT